MRLPSPFATTPHPVAQRAAKLLQEELRSGAHDGLAHSFFTAGAGKMLGILVVRDSAGRLGFVRASSGMLGGDWRPVGFSPPLFDDAARDKFWPRGQVALNDVSLQISALECGEEAQNLASRLAALQTRHRDAEDALRTEHKASKVSRAARRASGVLSAGALAELSHESQSDRRAGKALRRSHRDALALLEKAQHDLAKRIRVLKDRRTDISNALLEKIQHGYRIRNALGDTTSLSSLYPDVPPGGSGDCAGPKLLGYAYQHALTPIAFAEFWWGSPPLGGGRHSGQFYPACRGKCGPLLAFMLQGLDHQPPPLFGSQTARKDAPPTIYEDEYMFAVNKPCAMLSVPGATSELRDSALTRLRDSWRGPEKPRQVHRLDRDTSGVLLLAKTREAHKAMQALFAERSIEKRYVAWLDGEVARDRGSIVLPLRVDLDDRPRQIVDPIHGKEAITDYEVLERRGSRTKVAFFPQTGRSHQLRVHAAHEKGLAAPIVGDRLYGKPAPRLFLHAESLQFDHPQSGHRVVIRCPPEANFDPAADYTDS